MVQTAQDDSFYANNARTLVFTITNEDEDGSPALDLTGLTIKWALSRVNSNGVYSTTPVLEKSTSDGITITDAAAGECEVQLDAADTTSLSGTFYQELEVFSGGSGTVVAVGTITIKRNVVNS